MYAFFPTNFQPDAMWLIFESTVGVFGVASDECLFNAIENRRLWELEGLKIVNEMEESFRFEVDGRIGQDEDEK